MSMSIEVPLTISQIANLVKNISIAFWAAEKEDTASAKILFWDGSDIRDCESSLFPSDSDLWHWIVTLYNRKTGGRLEERAQDFAVTVQAFSKGSYKLKTKIFNASLLYDLVNGQTIPPQLRKYIVWSTRNCYEGEFEKFIDWRDEELKRAERISRGYTIPQELMNIY